MLARLDHVAADALSALHRERIAEPAAIRRLLGRLFDAEATLHAGVARGGQGRETQIVSLDGERIVLRALSGKFDLRVQAFFTTEIEAVRYFFASTPIERSDKSTFVIEFPKAIYRAERRGERRERGEGRWVTVLLPGTQSMAAQTIDVSVGGASIEVDAHASLEIPEEFRLRQSSGEIWFARVRSRRAQDNPRLVRIGASLSATPSNAEVAMEARNSILPEGHPA